MKLITSSRNDKLQKLFCTYAIHCRTVTYKKVFRSLKRATSSIVHVDLAPIGQQGAVLAVTASISPVFFSPQFYWPWCDSGCTEKERNWDQRNAEIRGTLPPLCTGSHWLSWEPEEEVQKPFIKWLRINSCCWLWLAECLLKLFFRVTPWIKV